MNYKKPYLAATTYTIIIGFSFLFVKIALTYTSPIDILAHRFTVAFLFAVLINFHQKKVRGIHLKDVIKIFPLALFYPALFFMFQVFGLAFISTSEAGILQATVPIFTLTLAGIVLKEYADNLRKVSIVISVLGVVYIYIMNDINVESYNITGIVLILLSTLSLAFYNVLARRLTRQYLLFILTFYMTFIGFIAFNGTALIIHLLNNSLSSFWVPLFHSEFIISILYLGVLSSFLTSFL